MDELLLQVLALFMLGGGIWLAYRQLVAPPGGTLDTRAGEDLREALELGTPTR